ncbi:MDR family oxidoreductase [Leucobacter ruminantium]|uniref:Oxidoreductase n=1 Tax=Leucobacter ruminantium TaxID=1289170 RepID=A0A939LX70_9MICO|nr:MDR family oxidoreductase [Leucobacter ruminantium]MBO1805756.1 oxidoreductase [Leucobacter ruminantium]
MRAIVIESKGAEPRIVEDSEAEELLRAGEGSVELDVLHSSFNYKDGLALAGKGIVRSWPLIPGIDVVGRVAASASDEWREGDVVVLNGDGLGETRNGGFATRARVRPDALVRLPEGISPDRAAAIGTAGFTAMLCVLALEDAGVEPGAGDLLVTGAAGGVGSVAISLLAGRGYRVVASTGRADEQGDYLRELGAVDLIDRRELSEELGKPLQSQRWAGAVDSVGSTTLANVLAQTGYGGAVAACGLAQGADLPTTVMPFILRGVTLAGANSVDAPRTLRQRAWKALAAELDLAVLDGMTETIGLAETIPHAERILAGRVRGRTVVDVNR